MNQRYAMSVAYDGSEFEGWQVQPGRDTVQGCIEQAFGTLCSGTVPRIQGSGRTDAGVHARGQVFHVNPAREGYAPEKWRESLNGVLPDTIRIQQVREVSDTFHARYDAIRKEYRYFIQTGPAQIPTLRHVRYYRRTPFNLVAMREAAERLVGRHDFTSFSATRGEDEEGDPVRTLEILAVESDADGFFIRAVGDGFLYKMVRRLTGALLAVGEESLSERDLAAYLTSPRRDHLIQTAPPHGLMLWSVEYPHED